MSDWGWVAAAAAAFVGSHLSLSHLFRGPLVAALGSRGFLLVYSLVAAGTLGWLVSAYRASALTPPLWPVGDAIWAVATVVTLVASVLFMGSLVRNPAFPSGGPPAEPPREARGVYAVTRHPMMWAFALWGLAHIAVHPVAAQIVLAGSIVVLALAGSALQDRKKLAREPGWRAWEARTSFWPFAAIAGGRARLGGFGGHALGGGVVLWLGATWAHMPLAGWAAGVWRWIHG
ncbi:NnrU family protein [Sphingomonas lenta]|uniref:MFS transporter n=1 Tax=Sphingomonas lenta TaxID=1141887 RepID=A0A2A2SEI6_9SPHN|nr:NnrU family protein [Sphingomonas lenta]PAX07658.1 MFS transporter [Sphingomonas lenta]